MNEKEKEFFKAMKDQDELVDYYITHMTDAEDSAQDYFYEEEEISKDIEIYEDEDLPF